jgi:hypothetical protein
LIDKVDDGSVMADAPIFNSRRHKLLRKRIPAAENLITLGLCCALAGIVGWVAAQKNHFDPADRDISAELLRQASRKLELYHPPLKTWHEPGDGKHATASSTADLGPFPPGVVDPEWRPVASVKQFGPDNLFEKINGEAPRFLKQGFQALHYLVLRSGSSNGEIAIELFDQGAMSGSLGVFSEHQTADVAIEQQGDVVFFRTSIGLIGRKGRFFFRVAGDAASEPIRQKARQLAVAFSQLPEAQANPESEPIAFRVLRDALRIPPELIAFQTQNVFQYDFARDFWFGRPGADEPAAVFIHQAASPEQAQQLIERLLEEQGYEYERVEQSETGALLRHQFLKNHFTIGRTGRFVFGSENVADQERSRAIQRQLSEALADG